MNKLKKTNIRTSLTRLAGGLTGRNREITIDPTGAESTILQIGSRQYVFPHAKRDAGASLVRKLKGLKLNSKDKLYIIAGPGNFTACRLAALIANSLAFLTGCKLFTKKVAEKEFKPVKQILPYYASAPNITPSVRLGEF